MATAGNVSVRFIYGNLGTAEKMTVEIYKPDGTMYSTWDVPAAKVQNNSKVLNVPLTPAQMAYTVKVYAVDANGNKGAAKSISVSDYAWAILKKDAYAEYHYYLQ